MASSKGLVCAALALLALSLSGCGGGKAVPTTTTTTTQPPPAPAPSPTPPTPAPKTKGGCLCIFDVDRTLTAIQPEMINAKKQPDDCKDVREYKGVKDSGYSGGTLRLSALALHLNSTFCNKCFHGIVSSGQASGHNSPERLLLQNDVLGGLKMTLSDHWADTADDYKSANMQSLVAGCPQGHKPALVQSVADWVRSKTADSMEILDADVWFFDDRADTIKSFTKNNSSFNAIQVSCASRDKHQGNVVGFCGATPAEVDGAKPGIHLCPTTTLEKHAATEAIAV